MLAHIKTKSCRSSRPCLSTVFIAAFGVACVRGCAYFVCSDAQHVNECAADGDATGVDVDLIKADPHA